MMKKKKGAYPSTTAALASLLRPRHETAAIIAALAAVARSLVATVCCEWLAEFFRIKIGILKPHTHDVQFLGVWDRQMVVLEVGLML
jgi:pheromone shutdown protein TraB